MLVFNKVYISRPLESTWFSKCQTEFFHQTSYLLDQLPNNTNATAKQIQKTRKQSKYKKYLDFVIL